MAQRCAFRHFWRAFSGNSGQLVRRWWRGRIVKPEMLVKRIDEDGHLTPPNEHSELVTAAPTSFSLSQRREAGHHIMVDTWARQNARTIIDTPGRGAAEAMSNMRRWHGSPGSTRVGLEPLGHVPPAEYEDQFDRRGTAPVAAGALTPLSLRRTRGDSYRHRKPTRRASSSRRLRTRRIRRPCGSLQ